MKKSFLSFSTRELVLAVVAGVASAAISHVLGRSVHMFVPIPMLGSLLSALPRSVVLLVVLARLKRFGAVTVAGAAESFIALGLGGMFPVSFLAPLLSGLAADCVWTVSRRRMGEKVALVLSGGVLSGTRVLTAVLILVAARMPILEGPSWVMFALWGVVIANVILGMLAGLMASAISRELELAGAEQ